MRGSDWSDRGVERGVGNRPAANAGSTPARTSDDLPAPDGPSNNTADRCESNAANT